MEFFDGLQTLDSIISRLRHGRGHFITWIPYGTYSGFDVERMLRSYGIKVYARQQIDKQMEKHLKDQREKPGRHNGLTVPLAQAEWAEWLMLRYGVPITSPFIKESHARVVQGPMPKPWEVPAKPVGLFGRVVAGAMGEIRYVGKELSIKRLLK